MAALTYIPSADDPRMNGGVGDDPLNLLWRLLDDSVGDEQSWQPEDNQQPDGSLEALIARTARRWRRRHHERSAVGSLLDAVAVADDVPTAASVRAFLSDVLRVVHVTLPADADEGGEGSGLGGLFDWTVDVRAGLPDAEAGFAAAVASSDAGWALYVHATLHGLKHWRKEAAAELLTLSLGALVGAVQLASWDEALLHRGRHQVALAALAGHSPPDHAPFMLHNPNPIQDEIGWELARAHSRQQALLGDVRLSAAGLAFDIETQLRASSQADVSDFLGAYEAGASPELRSVLRDFDHLEHGVSYAPSERFRVEASTVHIHAASSGINLALCDVALRAAAEVQTRVRDRAARLGASATANHARLAAELACDVWNLADDIGAAACAAVLRTLTELADADRSEDLARAIGAALPYLDVFLSPPKRDSTAHLGAVALGADRSLLPAVLLAHSRAVAASHDLAGAAFTARVLSGALTDPTFAAHRDEVIALLIRLLLRSARLRRSPEPIAHLRTVLAEAHRDGAGDPDLVGVALRGCDVLLGNDARAGNRLADDAGEYEELADLVMLVAAAAPPVPLQGIEPLHRAGVSERTQHALAMEDWPGLADAARADLAVTPTTGTVSTRVVLVGLLARGLRGMADTTTDPTVVVAVAREVRALLDDNTDRIMSAAGRISDRKARWMARRPARSGAGMDRDLWLLTAGHLGLAVVALHRRVPDGVLPDSALQLLKRAAGLAMQGDDELARADAMHDLAQAYVALVATTSRDGGAEPPQSPESPESLEMLQRAAALMREAAVLYRRLRARPDLALTMRDRPAHIDLLNLGDTYLDIASRLLAGEEISEAGRHPGPLYLRAALWTLTAGRDLALQAGERLVAARTGLRIAQVKIELAEACLEHTRANRGAFRRDFQLFLAVIEAVPESTWEFASRYALSALDDVTAALISAVVVGDGGGCRAALKGAFQLLGLAQLRHGVSGSSVLMDDNVWNMSHMRAATLVALHDTFDQLIQADVGPVVDDEVRTELAGWTLLLRTLLRVERLRRRPDADDFAAVATDAQTLRRGPDPILRAFARPYADWYSVSRSGDRLSVNGFAVAPHPAGLEIVLPSQGRSFTIAGLDSPVAAVQLREASWVKRNSTVAVAGHLPQFDWSGTPAAIPVLVGTLSGGDATFLVARLPAAGWDVWVMHIAPARGVQPDLTFPFTLRGIVSPGEAGESSGMRRQGGALARGDVAVLDAPGLTIEISTDDLPAGDDDSGDRAAGAEVNATTEGTRLRLTAEVRVAVRTAPAVVDADLTVVVDSGDIFAGACAAALSTVVAPALGVPSTMMRAHVQLLPYLDVVDARLRAEIRDSSHRHVVLVGVPATDDAADDLLDAATDPRRDVTWIVDGDEAWRAAEAVNRRWDSIEHRQAAPVFAVAGSVDLPFDDSPLVQVVVAPRHLAPAALQLVADLVAFRRLPIEDIPTASFGYEFELLGDPVGMRRGLTRLPNPATLGDIVSRYRELSADLPIHYHSAGSAGTRTVNGQTETFVDLPGPSSLSDRIKDSLWRPLVIRPAIVVPEDLGLVLACTPYARHLGALLLPDQPLAWQVASVLGARTLAVDGCRHTPADLTVDRLPGDTREIAMHFAARARTDHEAGVLTVRAAEAVGAADELLLRRMEPAAYAVVASLAPAERGAAALAASYAATLGSPLLLIDDDSIFSADTRSRAADILSGASQRRLTRDARPLSAHAAPAGDIVPATAALAELEQSLATLAPTYLAFVSNRMTSPIELAGSPPLATRYALGRLTAPDVPALESLIRAAALREEVMRDPRASAVVTDAAGALADRPLPEAAAEARHVGALLAHAGGVDVTEVTGSNDRDQFLSAVPGAAIIHFCGHGRYSASTAGDTGLVFQQGLLRARDIPHFASAAPIVFGNACESGAARVGDDERLGRAWSGLAAGFIDAGALNYIGSMWPILDDGSRRLAERFYGLLVQGHSVGESLRRAKLHAFEENDPTWASVILFGCPRNRLMTGDADRS